MSKEIELKLEMSQADGESLRDDPGLPQGSRTDVRQLSVYFDTRKGLLAANGFTLRVRSSGDRFVQTLKRTTAAEGLFSRDEWEWELDGDEPDAGKLLPLVGLGIDIGKLGSRLRPQLSSEVERTSFRVREGDSDLRLDMDLGNVSAAGESSAFAELEIELVEGDAADVVQAARALAGRVPVRLGVLSKAERGQALADATLDRVSKAVPVRVDQAMSVAEAFTAIVQACIKHYRLNEGFVIERRQVEALHQARVAMRRLRSAFTFFRPVIADSEYGELREELRRFTAGLGEARNLDVYLMRDLPEKERRALSERREKAYDSVVEAMNSAEVRLLPIALIGWLATGEWRDNAAADRPIGRYAARRLDKLWGRVDPAGRSLARMSEELRHELRIDVKKMRYAIEFFDQVYPASQAKTAFGEAIEGLQESLGKLNDLATARELVDRNEDHWLSEQSEELAHLRESENYQQLLSKAGPFWRQ